MLPAPCPLVCSNILVQLLERRTPQQRLTVRLSHALFALSFTSRADTRRKHAQDLIVFFGLTRLRRACGRHTLRAVLVLPLSLSLTFASLQSLF